MKIIECIPNFSEGRDPGIVEAIAGAAAQIEGIKVLDFSMDRDHNRSVLTFIGSPEASLRGAIAACDMAAGIIDMRKHSGVHPRIGAVDVVPFVPMGTADMSDAVEAAHSFGRIFGRKQYSHLFLWRIGAQSEAKESGKHSAGTI